MSDRPLASSQPIRVCHLGKYYPPAPGGIETHVQTLARAQARLGADARVVCVNHADRRGRDVTWERYGATATSDERDGPVRVTRLGRSATFARLDVCPALPSLIEQLNHEPPDVLHLHTPNPTMVLAVAGLLRQDLPLVVSHHSDIVRQRLLLRWLHGPFERIVYDRAAAVLTSSPMYVEASETLRTIESKVHAVPLGIDPAPYRRPSPAALRESYELRRRFAVNGPLWLAVGRCVYYKGFELAIQALARVPGTLLLIGSGPLAGELDALARRLGVRDRVAWWPHASADELVGAYLAATALWFPSSARAEAFGIVQVEAMAAGCPVINTDILGSGVPWVSLHGQTGLTVPVNDAPALAAAARRLLEEPGLRRRLAEGAVRRVRQEFEHETMARRTLAIYRRVLERQEPRAVSPIHSRLSSWIRQTSESGNGNGSGNGRHEDDGADGHVGNAHAGAAPLRGEPLRRG